MSPEEWTDRYAPRRPRPREWEVFKQRTVEGLTLDEIAARHGLCRERIRLMLIDYFQVRGSPPAARERKKRRARERAAATKRPTRTGEKLKQPPELPAAVEIQDVNG